MQNRIRLSFEIASYDTDASPILDALIDLVESFPDYLESVGIAGTVEEGTETVEILEEA